MYSRLQTKLLCDTEDCADLIALNCSL